MTKLMIMPSKLDIQDLIENGDAFLFGYKGMSVNFLNTVDMNDLKALIPKLKDKQLFIAINKNFHNPELKQVKEVMEQLSLLQIDGIIYYDVAVLEIKLENKIDIPLIWGAEHLTTNYATMNYWPSFGVNMTYVSAEITKQEILEIKKNTKMPLIVPIFGHLPMFVSERHEIKNYLNHFQIQDNSKIYYMEKEGKQYPVIDNQEGTFVYSSYILNGYQEYLEFQEQGIDYVLLNENFIERNIFKKVLQQFKSQEGNDDLIHQLCNENTSKGFLYQETVYQVKNYE